MRPREAVARGRATQQRRVDERVERGGRGRRDELVRVGRRRRREHRASGRELLGRELVLGLRHIPEQGDVCPRHRSSRGIVKPGPLGSLPRRAAGAAAPRPENGGGARRLGSTLRAARPAARRADQVVDVLRPPACEALRPAHLRAALVSRSIDDDGVCHRWGVDNGIVYDCPTRLDLGAPCRVLHASCGAKHTVALTDEGVVSSRGAAATSASSATATTRATTARARSRRTRRAA